MGSAGFLHQYIHTWHSAWHVLYQEPRLFITNTCQELFFATWSKAASDQDQIWVIVPYPALCVEFISPATFGSFIALELKNKHCMNVNFKN